MPAGRDVCHVGLTSADEMLGLGITPLTCMILQEMLDQLEGRFVQLTSAPTAKKKAAAPLEVFAGMDASAWQGLQAATVIRRLLHPQRLAQVTCRQ